MSAMLQKWFSKLLCACKIRQIDTVVNQKHTFFVKIIIKMQLPHFKQFWFTFAKI